MNNQLQPSQFLQRTGGWYVMIVLAVAQLVSILGAVPGIVSIRLNVDLSERLIQIFSRVLPLLGLASYLALIGIGWPDANRLAKSSVRGVSLSNRGKQHTMVSRLK